MNRALPFSPAPPLMTAPLAGHMKETFSSSAPAWLSVWAVAAGGETGGGVVAAGVTPGVVCVATATSPAAGVVVVVVVAGGVALACAGALAGGRTRRTWPISITSGLGSCWFQRMMSRQSWLYSAAILRTVSPGRTVW